MKIHIPLRDVKDKTYLLIFLVICTQNNCRICIFSKIFTMTPEPVRTVMHLDLDSFFVSVERLKDSRLNGLPLLIGGSGDRAVVASCSYEARKFGIHSAMPMQLARRLCPHAVVVSGDYEAYSQHSQVVTEIIQEEAPLYEKASIDEFYIDLTGMERFFGSYRWGHDLRARITRETGLPLSMGLSVNKMVSKVATNEAKPNGERQVSAPEVLDFLAPMPVQKIPMVGEKTTQQLSRMGVKTVSVLRQIPRPALERAFGKMGLMLYRRARGEDDSPVEPYSEQKSMSTETTFEQDTTDIYKLRTVITHMVEQLAFQLRSEHKLASCVTVKLRYADFDTHTRQETIAYTSHDDTLLQKALYLFEKLYERRLLVRLVGVRLSGLVPGGLQMDLFRDTPRQAKLYEALDVLRHRHGEQAVQRASGWRHGRM